MAFERIPIAHRHTVCSHSRESEWLKQYRATHVTLPQAAGLLGLSRDKASFLLGAPDLRCPYGVKTRLWRRARVDTLNETNP